MTSCMCTYYTEVARVVLQISLTMAKYTATIHTILTIAKVQQITKTLQLEY